MLLLAGLFVQSVAVGQEWEWYTFTNADEVRKMALSGDDIWCATNGGILRFNVNSQEFIKYTNIDGLSKIDIRTIATDRHGNIWAADGDGLLNYYNAEKGGWNIKSHYRNQVINAIYPYGDSLFVAFDEGLSLFIPNPKDPQGWEVKETYYIGNCSGLVVADKRIWAAMDESVKTASLLFPNLQAPSAWTTYAVGSYLPGSQVNSVFLLENKIGVATNNGISLFEDNAWSENQLAGENVLIVVEGEQTVYAVTATALFKKEGAWTRLARENRIISDLLVDNNNSPWISSNKSIALFDESTNQFRTYKSDGPVDNKFNGLTFDQDGNLWAASINGVSFYDGVSWRIFDRTSGITVANSFQDIAVDSENRIWAASWGGGITIFERQPDGNFAFTEINSSDSKLAGIPSASSYVVITGLRPDDRGNMWILNYLADNKRAVAVTDGIGNWQYFSTLEGLHSTQVSAIEIDSHGRKWIGTDDAGISVIDDGGTPFDKSDDDLSQGLRIEDGLGSEHIRCIAEDIDGVIWIGTPEGLNYWFDGRVSPKYGTINDDINCVLVDAANNKWIGTTGGMTRLHSDGFQMTHYSTDNSPLPANNVAAFAFNDQNGEIFIGTTNGLVRLRTPFTKPATTLSQVSGYPNPFLIEGPHSRFTIDKLAENSSVSIYTAEGYLVKRYSQDQIFGASIRWDGRNEKGEAVSSGIYLYLVSTEKGLTKTGKFAVIKP